VNAENLGNCKWTAQMAFSILKRMPLVRIEEVARLSANVPDERCKVRLVESSTTKRVFWFWNRYKHEKSIAHSPVGTAKMDFITRYYNAQFEGLVYPELVKLLFSDPQLCYMTSTDQGYEANKTFQAYLDRVAVRTKNVASWNRNPEVYDNSILHMINQAMRKAAATYAAMPHNVVHPRF
jgi:hypothetical protein